MHIEFFHVATPFYLNELNKIKAKFRFKVTEAQEIRDEFANVVTAKSFTVDNIPSYPHDHASSDIKLHRSISASLLPNDLTVIEKWAKDNLVLFNQSRTKQAVISRKRNQNFPAVFMNGDELDTSASFTQLGLSLSYNLTWKTHIHSLAKHASQKLGFLARSCGFFSSSHLLSIYKSHIRPSF